MPRKLLTDFEWESDSIHTGTQDSGNSSLDVRTMDFFSPLVTIIIVLSVVATVVAFIAIICCCICKRRSYQGTVYRQAPQTTATVTTYPQAPYQPSPYPSAPPQMHYPGAGAASAPFYPQQVVYPPQPSYQQGPYYTAQTQPLMAAGCSYPQQELKKEYDEAPPPYSEAMMTKASAPPPE